MGPQQSGRKRPRGNGSGRYRSVSRDLEEAATPPTPVLPPLEEEEMEVEEDVWAPLVRVGRRGHSVFYIKAGAAWSFRVTPPADLVCHVGKFGKLLVSREEEW